MKLFVGDAWSVNLAPDATHCVPNMLDCRHTISGAVLKKLIVWPVVIVSVVGLQLMRNLPAPRLVLTIWTLWMSCVLVTCAPVIPVVSLFHTMAVVPRTIRRMANVVFFV